MDSGNLDSPSIVFFWFKGNGTIQIKKLKYCYQDLDHDIADGAICLG